MKNLFVSLLLIFSLSSCEGDEGPTSNAAQLRIKNVDTVGYDQVVVNFQDFGPLSVGETSDYLSFDEVYRYDLVQIIVDNDTCIFQPIDFVGETKYETGKFRYDLKREIISQFEDCFVEIDFIQE